MDRFNPYYGAGVMGARRRIEDRPTPSDWQDDAPMRVERIRECPRCFQQCGWCSDYRHMHGTLNLPGTRRKCGVPGFEPEGDRCPVCHGVQKVRAVTTFHPIPSTPVGEK